MGKTIATLCAAAIILAAGVPTVHGQSFTRDGGDRSVGRTPGAGGGLSSRPERTPSYSPKPEAPFSKSTSAHSPGREKESASTSSHQPGEDVSAPTAPEATTGGSQKGGKLRSSGIASVTTTNQAMRAGDDSWQPRAGRNGWFICNKTDNPILHVAINAYERGLWRKSGWYNVATGDCITVQSHLGNRFAYYHAWGSTRRFTGSNRFCAAMTESFRLAGKKCPEGFQLVGFRRVEFGGGTSFTLNLK